MLLWVVFLKHRMSCLVLVARIPQQCPNPSVRDFMYTNLRLVGYDHNRGCEVGTIERVAAVEGLPDDHRGCGSGNFEWAALTVEWGSSAGRVTMHTWF